MKEAITRVFNKAEMLWGVSHEAIIGRSRNRPLPFARAMVAKTLRDTFGLTFMDIGRLLRRNHTSIIYYLKMYDAEYKYNKEFRNFANAMKDIAQEVNVELKHELENELNEIYG